MSITTGNVHSGSKWRDLFILAAADTFFREAFHSFTEDQDREDDGHEYPDSPPDALPLYAYVLAGEMISALETANGVSIFVLGARANQADCGEAPDASSDNYTCDVDPEEFADRLAMEYMGSGVSWEDDHEPFEIKIPTVEISGFTFDPAAYRGE